MILPELISKEPLGPSVRRGDDEFFTIVKWIVFALIEAEEYGITQANVDQMKTSTDPVVQRILGTSEDTGKLLGLDKDWAYRADQVRRQLRRDLRAQRRTEVGAASCRAAPTTCGTRAASCTPRRCASTLAGRTPGIVPRVRRPRGGEAPRETDFQPANDSVMAAPAKQFRWSWRSAAFRGLIYQIVAVLLVVAAGWYLVHNTLVNMRVRGIQSGFDFLTQPAGFAISESLWEFDSAESYAKAYLIGLSNTLRVALLGIVLATITGTLVGIGRLSRNFLVRSLCTAYVELFRNVPLLLQLFIWYFVFTEFLPPIDEALQPLPGVFFSKNGLQYPIPVWATGHLWMVGRASSSASSPRGTGAKVARAPVRGHGACAARRPARAGPDRRHGVPRLARWAARRRRSTSRRRPRSPWSAAAPSRRNS